VRLSLTRTVVLKASHFLRLEALSEEQNRARFGWTVDPHDHEYRVSVTVSGPQEPRTGMVMDLLQLDHLLRDEVTAPHYGTSLNETLPPVKAGTGLPVCEVLAAWFFERIAARLPAGVRLDLVRVAEDDTLHADCTGRG
jgi:6-pyruvoyltetrahydropterin/6-carboxytetrahydropterin synthase